MKQTLRRFPLAVALLFLAGCTTGAGSWGAAIYPAAASAAEPAATRLFVPPNFALQGRFAAIAILAIPYAPADRTTFNRYREFCKGYMTVLPDTGSVSSDIPQMLTVWPRKDLARPLSVSRTDNLDTRCNTAVAAYAHAVASDWLRVVPRRARFGADKRGPFLVAWAPPSARGRSDATVLTFDLSDFEHPESIRRALRLWKSEIENHPELWGGGGWNIDRWRARSAAILDRYGPTMLAAIKLVPVRLSGEVSASPPALASSRAFRAGPTALHSCKLSVHSRCDTTTTDIM